MAAIKEVGDTKIGDTITGRPSGPPPAAPRFLPVKPMCSAPLPAESAQYDALPRCGREAPPERLLVHLRPETSLALGFGFRCGSSVCCT